MDHTEPRLSETLLTPVEAGQRLLEEATKAAVITHGAAGLRPVVVGGKRLFRLSEVDALARMVRSWSGSDLQPVPATGTPLPCMSEFYPDGITDRDFASARILAIYANEPGFVAKLDQTIRVIAASCGVIAASKAAARQISEGNSSSGQVAG